MKKKLLLVVGAGASVDFGLPSVADVDGLLDASAGAAYPLADTTSSNLYRHCRAAIQSYYDGGEMAHLRKQVNFEEILYHLNLLNNHQTDPNHQLASNALLSVKPLPDVLEFGNYRRQVDGATLQTLAARLMDDLVDCFIDRCEAATVGKTIEVSLLSRFLRELMSEFDIGIITLNYDDIFTRACPELHTGFSAETGLFLPRSVLERTEWKFIYHLHGSVHFAMRSIGSDLHALTWSEHLSKGHAVHAFGRNAQNSLEGATYPMSPIIAGYGKIQQLLRQPFRTYFAQANCLAHEADALMFLGYGFADPHLNVIFNEIRDRHRPAVVIDWANDDQDPLQFRDDLWTQNVADTLQFDRNRVSQRGHVAAVSIRELKEQQTFEVSNESRSPFSVWYNGFLAACRKPEKIIAELTMSTG